MDPEGTIYILINLIVSFVLCLYIAAVKRQEEYDDFAIGISESIVSGVLLFMTNFAMLIYFATSKFSFVWQCVFLALFVFIGCFLPYCLGIALSEKLQGLIKALSPVITVLNYTVATIIVLPIIGVFKLFKLDTQTAVTQRDVMDLVGDATEDIIDDEQKEMIENIFELEDTIAGDIMTHRTALFAANQEETCLEVIQKMKTEGFSRIPVYSGTIDTIIGILYVKDLLSVIDDEEKLNSCIKTLVRKAMFVPESCPAKDLLVQFKIRRMQMAVVVDEYGGTSGIITMEDILEEIVGNIQDEYDNEEDEYVKLDDNTLVCMAAFDLEEALELLGIEVDSEDIDEEFGTVGGLIIDRLARIPDENEKVSLEYMGAIFTVLEVADRRIVKVKAEVVRENAV